MSYFDSGHCIQQQARELSFTQLSHLEAQLSVVFCSLTLSPAGCGWGLRVCVKGKLRRSLISTFAFCEVKNYIMLGICACLPESQCIEMGERGGNLLQGKLPCFNYSRLSKRQNTVQCITLQEHKGNRMGPLTQSTDWHTTRSQSPIWSLTSIGPYLVTDL